MSKQKARYFRSMLVGGMREALAVFRVCVWDLGGGWGAFMRPKLFMCKKERTKTNRVGRLIMKVGFWEL